MTTLVATVGTAQTPLPTTLVAGVTFAAIGLTITDNSGAAAIFTDASGNKTTSILLTGAETPPWTATATGVSGQGEASYTAQALDSTGANLGTSFTFTESGSGGVVTPPATFPQPVLAGSSLVVTA